MRPTPRLAVVVLASFLTGGIVPQAALVSHDHADGATPHVHAGALHEHRHDGGDPHAHVEGGDGGPALALPHHVHTQRPFHLVDRAAPPAPPPAFRAAGAPPIAPREPADRAVPSARSRGPPLHTAP
jgi:hypothetical protein